MFSALRRLIDDRVYHRDIRQYDWRETILWWEYRRSFYNVVVGVVGVVSGVLMISCGALAEPLVGEAIGIPDPPILIPIFVVVYGALANVCYTGGWIAEVVLARFRPNTNAFGIRAFRLGVKFSIFVTLIPAALSWAVFLFSLATGRRAAPVDQ